jgi:Flp pilus assembly protein TadG
LRAPRLPRRTSGRRARRAGRGDRGAALVEFALVSLPLFTILFGTVEFGWAFFQLNDIRHGAREGIRLVAVNADVTPSYVDATPTAGERLAQATCDRMDQSKNVTITIELTDLDGNGFWDVGDDVELTASKPIDQLTLIFDTILKSVTLEETIASRLEQDPPAGVDGTSWTCA